MLEIGSFEGGSAAWFLCSILTHPTARLVCIEPQRAWAQPNTLDERPSSKCASSGKATSNEAPVTRRCKMLDDLTLI